MKHSPDHRTSPEHNFMSDIDIRPATAHDAAAICAIYNGFVTDTTTTFEETPVTEADMAERIASVQRDGLPWLVASLGGTPIGYAYATKWRARAAYRHSVESTIYLGRHGQGHGFGHRLYRTLIDDLRQRGLRTVIAGIAQPNARSVALHERLRFQKVAHFKDVGFKLGQWIDVGYWQLGLAD